MLDPAENLAELLGAFFVDRPVPHHVRAWFLDGVLRAIRRGESIEAGLGIKGAGRRSVQRLFMQRVRDECLCTALGEVSLDADLSPWGRCTRLAPLVTRFQAETWPRYKYAELPPPGWPGYQKSLWRAAKTDLELPCSPHALRKILIRLGGYSRNSAGAILLHQLTP